MRQLAVLIGNTQMKRQKREKQVNPLFNFNEKLEETPVRSNWGSTVEKERRNTFLNVPDDLPYVWPVGGAR